MARAEYVNDARVAHAAFLRSFSLGGDPIPYHAAWCHNAYAIYLPLRLRAAPNSKKEKGEGEGEAIMYII